MMALEMVFWASKNGGDPSWYNKAVSQATKTMQNNVRPNGSVWQIVDYNPSTGGIFGKYNKQGYNDNTTWSRGQAWGICGFTIAYRETLDPNYLTTAKKIANYFIDHLPTDYVPYWDFNAPEHSDAPQVRDSSAAAIAASGLLELSTFVSEPSKGKYQNAAINILDSLSSPAYLAEGTSSMGILLHGTGNGNSGGEVDTSLMYGDHFYIEALKRYEELLR
jgi:unsaturated chondroitin disaccharide hydrolase